MKLTWAIVGTVSGVLSLLVAVAVFVNDLSSKRQSLKIKKLQTALILPGSFTPPEGRISYVYLGQELTGLSVVTYRIENDGGQVIAVEPILGSTISAKARGRIAGVQKIDLALLDDSHSALHIASSDVQEVPEWLSTAAYGQGILGLFAIGLAVRRRRA